MSTISFVEVQAGDPLLDHIEGLFVQLHAYMEDVHWSHPIVEGGEVLWRRAIERTLGHLGVMVAAVDADTVLGFAHGTLRIAPAFQGGHRAGVITFIYVIPEARGQAVGRHLVQQLEQWFRQHEAVAYELQVAWHNESALSFWRCLGFEEDLIQLRKSL